MLTSPKPGPSLQRLQGLGTVYAYGQLLLQAEYELTIRQVVDPRPRNSEFCTEILGTLNDVGEPPFSNDADRQLVLELVDGRHLTFVIEGAHDGDWHIRGVGEIA